MAALKFIVLVMNLAFVATIIYFLLPLKWSEYHDRPSIVGFYAMLFVLVVDMGLILFAQYF